jgi:uncharacterized protein
MDPSLPLYWAALAAAGFVIGTLVGMTGVGAGSLTTPVLVVGFGVHPLVAVGTNLLFAGLTKSTATWRHHRLGNVDWHILTWLAAGSVPAAALTLAALAALAVDTRILASFLRTVLGFALLISAVSIAGQPWLMHARGQTLTCQSAVGVGNRTSALIMVGAVLGTMVALTSVGAGAIGVVALSVLFPRLAARRIIGTDIVHAIPLTLISGLGHMALGNVDFKLLAAGRLDPRHRAWLAIDQPSAGVGAARDAGHRADDRRRGAVAPWQMMRALLRLAGGSHSTCRLG